MKKLIKATFIIFVSFIILNYIDQDNNPLQIKTINAATGQKYKIIKLKSGYKFKLFHDAYVSQLASGKSVQLYFNLSKVSSTKLKSSIKSVIKTYNAKRVSPGRIKLFYVKPKSKSYTVNVTQGKDNYLCDNSGWAYACANASVLYINKKTVNVSSNLQKRIIFHEFLHVFGLDHVKSSTKGTSLTPAVNDGHKKFSINNYPKDLEAWRILNRPFTTKKYKKGKKITRRTFIFNYYPYKRAITYKKRYQNILYYHPFNSKTRLYYKYDSKGRIYERKEYYTNGKTRKYYKKYYTNKKLREYIYALSNGKRVYKSDYHSNGKTKQYINYHTNGRYERINKYDIKGRILTSNQYYTSGTLKKYFKYNSSGKTLEFKEYSSTKKLIRHQINYSTGRVNALYTYTDQGKLDEVNKYHTNGNVAEILMYENNKLIRHIKYDDEGNVYFDQKY